MLSSIVIRHLEDYCKQQTKGEQFAVAYLYLDHKETKLQTYSNLIRSVLRQLLCDRDFQTLCVEVRDFYKNSKTKICPDDEKVLQILRALVSSPAFKRVYLIVDALDEYPEMGRAKLLTTFQSIVPAKLSLFVTSRAFDEVSDGHIRCITCPADRVRYLNVYFYCPICPKFDICQECKNENKSCSWGHQLLEPTIVTKQVKAPDYEIERFVKCVVKEQLGIADIRRGHDRAGIGTIGATRLGILFRSDPKLADELKSDIPKAIVRTAEGMFLLAKLHLDSLKLQTSLGGVRRALLNLPSEVGQIYTNILARIQEQKKDDVALAMQALSWVVLARRPLEIPELLQAMAGMPEEQTEFTIIMRVTAGLLINQGAVRMVHRTAQEYFENNWRILFPEAPTNIVQTTLTYLNDDKLCSPCTGDQEDLQISMRLHEYPFLAYASTYWGEHVQEVLQDCTTQDAVLKFLSNPSQLAATIQAAWYVGSKSQSEATWDVRGGVNAIHVCAWYGLDSCITTLIRQDPELQIDSQDEKLGQTPLMYACMRGHIATATTLLRLGADVNRANRKGSTAAFAAILNGHPQLVDLLLTQEGIHPPLDINTTSKENDGKTILMLAALNGYQPLLSHILNKPGINVNSKDSNGYTALALAATKAQVSIVKRLLEYVDIDVPNSIGSTALIIAAESGKDEMVKEMLKKNADWRWQNHDGDTAFSKAIIHGHTSVVKALLDHNVKYHVADGPCANALHMACSSKKTKPEMIDLLLREGLQIDARGAHKDTPLHHACRVGNIDVAKTLLKWNANQFLEDNRGRTPLMVAWQNGHPDLVKLLQSHPNRGVMTYKGLPQDSSLPLWSMAKLGYKDLLETALRVPNADIHERDPDTESTALHWAIRSNNFQIEKLLLEAGARTGDVDDHGRTPLHIAAYLGDYEAGQLLLAFGADPKVRNTWDLTPLSIAQFRKHNFLAVLLLEADASIVEGSPQEIQATFCAAIEMGILTVAQLLSEHGADLQRRNEQGQTPIELARGSGNESLLEWLRQRLYQSD